MVEIWVQFSLSVIQIIFYVFDCIKLGANDCGNDSFIVSFFDLFEFDYPLSNEPGIQMIPTCFGYFWICQRRRTNRFLQFGNARSDGNTLIHGPAQSVIIFRPEPSLNHSNDWSRVRAEDLGFGIVSEGRDPDESWVKLWNTKGDKAFCHFAGGSIFPLHESKPRFQKGQPLPPREFLHLLSRHRSKFCYISFGKALTGHFWIRHARMYRSKLFNKSTNVKWFAHLKKSDTARDVNRSKQGALFTARQMTNTHGLTGR
jgi:hypothetical protein